MKETHSRSFLKALSWRFSGSLITLIAVYLLTGKIQVALYIGSFEFFFKILFFYLHERLWSIIPFGVPKVWDKDSG